MPPGVLLSGLAELVFSHPPSAPVPVTAFVNAEYELGAYREDQSQDAQTIEPIGLIEMGLNNQMCKRAGLIPNPVVVCCLDAKPV